MVLFCEKAIRGGLNGIAEKRSMKANNKYLSGFDQSRPSIYGLFLDFVNLYGGTMTKSMPIGDFKWVEKSLSEIIAQPNDSRKGFFVMVDLEYPSSLHDNHINFPLAAAKMKISEFHLSSYQKSCSRHEATIEKLMETLFNKTDYVCHYSILKFFVKHELKVTKISKVLQFK